MLSKFDVEDCYTYLIEHAAFAWLVNRIAVAMATSTDTKTLDITRTALLGCIRCNNRFSLRLEWDLRDFFEDQYEDADQIELSSVICICGTVPCVQALSAGEYIDMIWPKLGLEVLKGMSTALKNASGKHQGKSDNDVCDQCSCDLRLWGRVVMHHGQ